jgi:hypothetical protein
MRAKISSVFNTSADAAWAAVKKSKTLLYVTKGFLEFKGSEKFPEEWIEGRTETMRLIFFKSVPGWRHQIHFTEINNDKRLLSSEECGGLVSQWNHIITVELLNVSQCTYTDDIDIKAGIFTPFVWMYAHIFYRYRQIRWRVLINREYNIA